MRFKIIKEGEVPATGHLGHTELSYSGGQDLSTAVEMGFGNPGGIKRKAVKSVREFKVYDRAVDYRQMDELFNAEQSPLTRTVQEDNTVEDENEEVTPEAIARPKLYPNPSDDVFRLDFHLPHDQHVQLTVTDLEGKKVWENKGFFNKGLNTWTLSRRNIKGSGLYILTMETGKSREEFKLLLVD